MNSLTVVDRAHSRISPSSFERAEACTASLRLSVDAPRAAPGPDALLGTAAHLLGETCLRGDMDTIELGDVRSVLVDDQDILVDPAMLDGVQVYLDAVRSAVGTRPFEVEAMIHLSFAEQYLGEPIWGHADVLVRHHPFLVVDLKNGFHPVPADAVQLGLYLLMVAIDYDYTLEREGHAGTTMIVQPNASGEAVRSHDWTWADLRDLRDRVITTLYRIKRQDWSFADGPWCRWCPAIGSCPHIAAVARDAALAMTLPTPELVASGEVTADTLADWLDVVDRLDAWAKAVEKTALDYVIHGGVLRGRKAVAKRTTRRWVDPSEEAVATTLKRMGVNPYQEKLITPAEAERRLPKARRGEVDPLTEKPAGELTLVPDDDPREQINVGAVLKSALRSSVAVGFIQTAQQRERQKGEKS